MGYNLKNARDGKSISKNTKMAKFGPLGLTEYCLYSSLNFQKIKRIWMENVAGEQGLAFQQLFLYKSSYFLKNWDCHKISFLNDGASSLAILIFSTCFFHIWNLLIYGP